MANQGIGKNIAINTKPEVAVTHYYTTKHDEQLFRKIPKIGRSATPITDLLAAKRKLDEAIKTLKMKREAMQNWGVKSKAKWSEIEQQEIELRKSFDHFNHFVAENHEKRERAKKKIRKETENQRLREQEIRDIESQVNYLQTVESDLDSKVKEYQIYKTFLQQVTVESQEPGNIQSVLNRYGTLAATRNTLGNQYTSALVNVQTAREDLAAKAEGQAQNMMGLHTQIAQLRVRYESACNSRDKWERTLNRARSFAAEKAVEIQQVRRSCWDMYKTLSKLRKEPINLPEFDTEQQLVYITRRNKELKTVTKIINEKLKKGDPESNVNVLTST